MRGLIFSRRCAKEIVRDPLTVLFGIGFPLIVLLLLSAIQSHVPVSLFEIGALAPGIAVFGLSFVALFSGMLAAKDRTNSFLIRLYASPMRASDFIVGYMLPFLPISVAQSLVCFLVSVPLGLKPGLWMLSTIAVLLPADLLFVSIGLICGSVLNDRQVGGICGALLTNVSAWLSGTWFDLKLLGEGFRKVAYVLPFANAVDASRAALRGDWQAAGKPLLIVCGWAVLAFVCSVLIFRRRMKL